jgi:glutaredoxin
MNVRVFENGRLVLSETPAVSTPKRSTNVRIDTTPEKQVPPQTSRDVEPSSLDILVKSQVFLVLSLPTCPQCEELASALTARGVPPSVFVKWDKSSPEYPALKAALAVHAGSSFSFPQVFVNAVYEGGYADVIAKLELGAYDMIFEEQFGKVPTTVKSWVERQPMVVFSLPNCPQCDELRALLDRRGVSVDEVFIKWDKAWPQYQSLKAQLVQLTGRSQFTFPQTFVRSDYQGSFDEVSVKVLNGSLDDFFADVFGVAREEPVLDAVLAASSAAISFDDDF